MERLDVLHDSLRRYFDSFVEDDCDFDYWVGRVADNAKHACHAAACEYLQTAGE